MSLVRGLPRRCRFRMSYVMMLVLVGLVAGLIALPQEKHLYADILSIVIVALFWWMQFRYERALAYANRALNEQVSVQGKALDTLKETRDELSHLVVHQDQIREDERKQIAAEIHDTLGQNLLALRLDVAALHARCGPQTRLHQKAGYALRTIDASIQGVRDMIGSLHPAVLDLGVTAAIEWQLKEFERNSKIHCTLQTNDQDFNINVDDGRTLLIFRALQEALTNTAHHAQATKIDVVLHISDKRLLMTVHDNGHGFQVTERRRVNAFGLIGIKACIDSLGGEFLLNTGAGTRLSISIPLPRERRSHAARSES